MSLDRFISFPNMPPLADVEQALRDFLGDAGEVTKAQDSLFIGNKKIYRRQNNKRISYSCCPSYFNLPFFIKP